MLATWALAGALILLQTATVRDYVGLLDAQGLRSAAEAPTPLRQVIPARNADAQMWVRHALAAACAEVGRFEEAVQAAERALALVRQRGGDESSVSLLAQRLAKYRARRPWRQ